MLDNIYAPCVIKENGKYRMWYTWIGRHPWHTRYAESDDGLHWKLRDKPCIVMDQPWEKKDQVYPMVVNADGAISVATARQISRAVDQARKENAAAIVIRLDTPGGLVTATRDIIRDIIAAPVPIIVYVAPSGALIIGLAAGVVCYFGATTLKNKLGYDDSLDAFGVHGIGGALGAILTGVFATSTINALGSGMIDGNAGQIITQLKGVGFTIIYTGIVTFVILKVIQVVMGLRVSEDVERDGLDLGLHGETVQ